MPLHRETENGRLQQDLMAGRLPLARYSDLLRQLLLLHRSFEAAIEGCAGSAEPLAAVVHPHQFSEAALRRDLAHFGYAAEASSALPSVHAFGAMVESWAQENPIALLGVLYVLEGSKNGGRYIARAVRRAYSVDGPGTEYLDPYGDEQAEKWQEFKSAMDSLALTENQRNQVVAAASSTFRSIMALHRELDGEPSPGAVD